jgi:gamma-glutamyl:cysteine ligase YbdK (ATP-grasp superfamily)
MIQGMKKGNDFGFAGCRKQLFQPFSVSSNLPGHFNPSRQHFSKFMDKIEKTQNTH